MSLYEQEDLETQKLFSTRLEALEKQMQNLPDELKTCVNDADSAQVSHGMNETTLIKLKL